MTIRERSSTEGAPATRRRGTTAACLAVAAAAGIACVAPPVRAQELLLTNGRFVDPESERVLERSLLVRDGLVVGWRDGVPAGFEGQVLDLDGGWVIPGLVDLHTHSFGNMAPGDAMEPVGTPVTARRMLYVGVFGFLDLFAPEAMILPMRDRQRELGLPGADIFAAGPCITAPDGHCSEYGVPTRLMSTPEEAREQVTELAARAPDVVKIVYSPTGRMPSIDLATLEAAVSAANDLGLPTVIHISDWNSAREAIQAGASAITHMGRGVVPDDVVALIAERSAIIIPTLSVELGVGDLVEHPEVLEDPLLIDVTSDNVRAAYADISAEIRERYAAGHAEALRATSESIRKLHQAGVLIVTGTDSGNWGTFQGYSMHRELHHLVAAGMTPYEALAAGSTRAAGFLGRNYGFSIDAEANFIVLDASPIEDIGNTRRIRRLIQRGEVVDRAALLGG